MSETVSKNTGSFRMTVTVPAGDLRVFELGASTFINIESMPGQMEMKIPGTNGFIAYAGFEYQTEPGNTFNQVTFVNGGTQDAAVKFYYGRGRVIDHSFRVVDQGAGLKVKSPDGLETLDPEDAGTAVPTLPAVVGNPETQKVVVYNPHGTRKLWAGDAYVDVGRGILIPPGEQVSIKSADNIFLRSEGGAITGVGLTRFFFEG